MTARAAPEVETDTGLPRVRPALVVSALRCVVVYMVVPMLGPVFGASRWVANPVALTLSLLGAALSTRAMARSLRAGRNRALLASSALASLNLLAVVALL